MRTIAVALALVAVTAASCKEDRIRRDLTSYNEAVQAQLDRAGDVQRALNDSARSANQGTDDDFRRAGQAIAEKVVPLAEANLKAIEALSPETPEVQDIQAKLVSVARVQVDGIKATADALRAADPAAVAEARKKLSAFKTRLSDWQEDYLQLTKRYRVGSIVK
jgi:hypothetical protein